MKKNKYIHCGTKKNIINNIIDIIESLRKKTINNYFKWCNREVEENIAKEIFKQLFKEANK